MQSMKWMSQTSTCSTTIFDTSLPRTIKVLLVKLVLICLAVIPSSWYDGIFGQVQTLDKEFNESEESKSEEEVEKPKDEKKVEFAEPEKSVTILLNYLPFL